MNEWSLEKLSEGLFYKEIKVYYNNKLVNAFCNQNTCQCKMLLNTRRWNNNFIIPETIIFQIKLLLG